MQRYSGGLKVPKMQIESFLLETSDGFGRVTVALKYTPKSLGHIAVGVPYSVPSHIDIRVESLTGRDLTVRFWEHKYYRTTAIHTENSGNVGSDPHTHSFDEDYQDLEYSNPSVEIPAFGVVYEIGTF